MSTNPAEPTQPAAPAAPVPPKPEPPKPTPPRTFTQDEVNAFVAEDKRKEREALVAKYGDFDQLKALADAQKAAEEAAKTELQKANDRAAAAEAKALEAERHAFAASKGIPASLVTGSTPQEWEKAAAEALEWKGKQAEQPATPPATPTVHAAGNNGAPAGAPGDIDAQIAEAEKARNFPLAIALKQRKFAASQNK